MKFDIDAEIIEKWLICRWEMNIRLVRNKDKIKFD